MRLFQFVVVAAVAVVVAVAVALLLWNGTAAVAVVLVAAAVVVVTAAIGGGDGGGGGGGGGVFRAAPRRSQQQTTAFESRRLGDAPVLKRVQNTLAFRPTRSQLSLQLHAALQSRQDRLVKHLQQHNILVEYLSKTNKLCIHFNTTLFQYVPRGWLLGMRVFEE